MRRRKWTDIAVGLVLVGGSAGAVASCTDVGDNTAAHSSDDSGIDATGGDDVGSGAETAASDDGSQGATGVDTGTGNADDAAADAGGMADEGAADTGAPETSSPEAGGPEAGVPDTGAADSTVPDTGIPEAGGIDTGASEGGLDAGAPEAGGADGGAPEGGRDAGAPEAGAAETGAPEGGTHDGGPGGDGGALITSGILSSQAPDCLSCGTTNGCFDPAMMGGTCEDLTGTATLLSGPLPDGKTCSDPAVLGSASPTEKQVCLVTLQTVFASKCAATLQQTPCLCGTTDSATCLAGTATPTGAAYDIYACDFQTTSSTAIQGKFMPGAVETTGAAQGTAIIQCLGAFGCNSCFGQ
jgi:hypothetical protein